MAKNQERNDKCDEINRHIEGSKSREAWKTIKNIRKNNRETIKMNMVELEEWKVYNEEMLNEDRDEHKQNKRHCIEKREDEIPIVSNITKNEIYEALKQCKNRKSPGPGNIPRDLIKDCSDIFIELLQTLFSECPIGEQNVHDKWRLGYIITVTLSVRGLYGRIIKNRIKNEIKTEEEEADFTADKSCVDHIFTSRQLT